MSGLKQCCPICGEESLGNRLPGSYGTYIECPKCGKFNIMDETLNSMGHMQIIQLAGILYERNLKISDRDQKLFICSERTDEVPTDFNQPIATVKELLEKFPKTVSERLDRALLNISRLTPYPGGIVSLRNIGRYYFFPQGLDNSEVFFFMEQLIQDQYLQGSVSFPTELTVTVKGWNRVAELEKNSKQESRKAFVAMWFSEEMNEPYERGIKEAILDTGFIPVRIDQKEHINKIDDEIIAEIKNSKFLIADFSGHRGGVYFEAGFAMGLGIPVIWCCREDHLKDLHFDTRQYSHIVWSDIKDLRDKLYNRIRATIV